MRQAKREKKRIILQRKVIFAVMEKDIYFKATKVNNLNGVGLLTLVL